MFESFETLLGLFLLVSFIAIIKPSLFHRFYKGLTRKKAALGFVLLFVTLNVSSLVYNNGGFTEQAAESAAQRASERAAADEAKKAEAERKKAEETAVLEALAKITITGRITKNSIGTPELRVSIKNGTDKTIDALWFQTFFSNNFGDPVGQWNRAIEEPFNGEVQDIIKPGATLSNGHWNLAVYESATKLSQPVVMRVHFTDGTELVRP
jgi:hypothetical protein